MYPSSNYHVNYFFLCLVTAHAFRSSDFVPSNLSLYLLPMHIKCVLFVFIVTALILRTSMPIKRGCAPTGFQHFEPLMSYGDAEDTGLLGLYVLYSPKKPRKLDRCEKLWRTRNLILMLLLIAGIEPHPGEFLYKYYFVLSNAIQFRLEHTKYLLQQGCVYLHSCNLSFISTTFCYLLPHLKFVPNEILKLFEIQCRT